MHSCRTKSSFSGVIEEIPDIAVDNFENKQSKAYFLSHCHTDHTNGLFSDTLVNYLKNNNVFVYMSDLSMAIIRHECLNKDLMDYVIPLKIGSTTITIPGEDESGADDQYITVSLIPAGHCFGSVMFLFKTQYKNVLYTGDFRVSSNSVSKYAQFHENGNVISIDAMYVDTTFQNITHNDFPKRSDSVDIVIWHIKQWLSKDAANRVALHTSAKYGYEFVFNEIYKKIGQKVYIVDDVCKLYSQFPKQVKGVTNNPDCTTFHKCKNRSESMTHEHCFPENWKESTSNYLFVHFSAYKWKGYQEEDQMIDIKESNRRIDVCFATHCSRSELLYFVQYLAPKRVVGFPNDCVDGITRKDIAKRASSAENCAPEKKVARMVDRSLVRQIFAD